MKNALFFLFFLLGFSETAICQNQISTIKSKNNLASVRIGKDYYANAWEMSPKPENEPEDIGFESSDKGVLVAVITDIDSIGFVMKQGEMRLFKVILNGKDAVWAKFIARYPKANFTEGYKKANDGKTFIEVPKVYELVNIIMAITPIGIRDSNMIEHDDPYYERVQKAFSPYKNHRAVAVMDSLLKADKYFDVKMDAYAYDFGKNGLLEKKEAYNRISWGNENQLMPYISIVQDFAKKSKFSKFYAKNEPFYASMIRAYRDSLGVPAMQTWLNHNFPSTRYNCFKIVFSPLVSGNQSATEFESNDFKEGQPHVNFPNFWYNPKTSKVSEKSVNLKRGNIVFTELNHLFENPAFVTEANSAAFNSFTFNMPAFADKNKAAGTYNNPLMCVEEYMNWALVSLRYIDFAPKEDWEALFTDLENKQANYRGFIKFKAFNRFLIDAYLKRPQGKVVADLYPQIIEWFRQNNQ